MGKRGEGSAVGLGRGARALALCLGLSACGASVPGGLGSAGGPAAVPDPERASQEADADADADADGVPDERDACPEIAAPSETDGCPPRGRECPPGPFAILDSIDFAPGTAEMAGRFGPILDAVAATLAGNPGVTAVEVRGHGTSAECSAHRGLAMDRARVVRGELVSRGIAETRLQPVALDGRCPPREGRGLARSRVDFRFLVIDGRAVAHEHVCTRYPGESEAGLCP